MFWRSVLDLPPETENEEDIRCVVVWQDSDHKQDQGVDTCGLDIVRRGDFNSYRHKNCYWRSVMDAPALSHLLINT